MPSATDGACATTTMFLFFGQSPQGAGMDPAIAAEAIINKMNKTKNNIEFLEALTAEK